MKKIRLVYLLEGEGRVMQFSVCETPLIRWVNDGCVDVLSVVSFLMVSVVSFLWGVEEISAELHSRKLFRDIIFQDNSQKQVSKLLSN